MKRNLIFGMGLLLISLSLSAQYQDATKEQTDEIVSKITMSSESMTTLQGDFTQVKELSFMDDKVTSEGKMYYKKPNKIRWEYTKPIQYIFSMDGKTLQTTSGDKTNKMPVKSSKIFTEISHVMIGSISGSGLVDSPDFDARFFVGKEDYKVVLTPKKKEIKDLFSSVVIYIAKKDSKIHTVETVEKSGDKTTITLKNVQVNGEIVDETFTGE